jgi:hemerythrin-like domain-containing protein
MNNVDLSRRWVIGAAGVGAASALVSVPAFPQGIKPADADKSPIPATEDLMREHGVLERVLLVYEATARRLEQGEDLESGIFTQSGEIMRDFVHGYHERLEEEHLFPLFKKAGRLVELVTVLEVQHEAGRKLTDKLLAAAPKIANSDDRKQMIGAMRATVTLYRPHVGREDTVLFPTVRSIMTPSAFEALGKQMDKEEDQKLGDDGFEKYVKKVEAIEKKLGTNDLSQYTPKT